MNMAHSFEEFKKKYENKFIIIQAGENLSYIYDREGNLSTSLNFAIHLSSLLKQFDINHAILKHGIANKQCFTLVKIGTLI